MSPFRRRLESEPALVLRDVSKSYRAGIEGCMAVVRVLTGLDLVVLPGERVAVIGEPGSGKTTLLLLAAGALRCDTGSVRAFGNASVALRPSAQPGKARGVAERGRAAPAGTEMLSWAEPRPTRLVVARCLRDVAMPVDRVLRLDDGRLHAVGVRVDSPSGPP